MSFLNIQLNFQKLSKVESYAIFIPHLLSCFPPYLGTLGLCGAPAISRSSRTDPGDDRAVPKAKHNSGDRKYTVGGGEP